jgi:hypothetical protein
MARTFLESILFTPAVWKQAHRVPCAKNRGCRWEIQALVIAPWYRRLVTHGSRRLHSAGLRWFVADVSAPIRSGSHRPDAFPIESCADVSFLPSYDDARTSSVHAYLIPLSLIGYHPRRLNGKEPGVSL